MFFRGQGLLQRPKTTVTLPICLLNVLIVEIGCFSVVLHYFRGGFRWYELGDFDGSSEKRSGGSLRRRDEPEDSHRKQKNKMTGSTQHGGL